MHAVQVDPYPDSAGGKSQTPLTFLAHLKDLNFCSGKEEGRKIVLKPCLYGLAANSIQKHMKKIRGGVPKPFG